MTRDTTLPRALVAAYNATLEAEDLPLAQWRTF